MLKRTENECLLMDQRDNDNENETEFNSGPEDVIECEYDELFKL